MDFSYSEEQVMVRDLARGILEKEVTSERIKAVEEGGEWFDRPLWATLAEAGLLGLAFDEEHGGMGFGFEELCVLLEEIGRVVAPLPAIAALVLGGGNIAEFGDADQKRKFLPAIAAGELIVTAAFGEAGGAFAAQPSSTARREGESWVIDGVKELVPAAGFAAYILVPAISEDGIRVFIVPADAQGLSIEPGESTTCETLSTLRLNSVRVAADSVLGTRAAPSVENGGAQLARMESRVVIAICACQVGVAEKALNITADYVREREQFGVPIGSFQAVQHRCADAYIDLQTTLWVT